LNEAGIQHKAGRIRERNKGKRRVSRLGVEREHERDEDNKQSMKED